jgi:hypothetical protein
MKAQLAALAKMTPRKGCNLVGFDEIEEPGHELYLIQHFPTRERAEDGQRRRASSNPNEVTYIYGDE